MIDTAEVVNMIQSWVRRLLADLYGMAIGWFVGLIHRFASMKKKAYTGNNCVTMGISTRAAKLFRRTSISVLTR
jgi:hypothetical protein